MQRVSAGGVTLLILTHKAQRNCENRKKTVRASELGCALLHSAVLTQQGNSTPLKPQQYDCPNETYTMKTPVIMLAWMREMSQSPILGEDL